MSRPSTEGPRTWFDPTEIGLPAEPMLDSAFFRLWRGFMTARVMVALVLLVLQVIQYVLAPAGHGWTLLLCLAYMAAVAVIRFKASPVSRGPSFDRQWQRTIGIDIVVFALLQWIPPHTVNYAPLLALPVLLAAVMGSLTLALGTASVVTLYLLGLAWRVATQVTVDSAPAFFQAGLTGIGYFVVAILANQLATRLLREEELTRRSQHAIQVQTQVNELVIETLSHGVIVVDGHGVVRAANPAAKVLIAPRHRTLAVPFALTEEPGWQALTSIAAISFLRRTAQQGDLSLQHAGEGARRVHVRTRLTSAQETHGESLCVVFIEDLPELEARLRQEKMVAMGRMSAAVAHEIRNPLAAITQANALLAEDLSDPAQQRLTAMVDQNARRLARIVEDVLNIARVPSHSEDLLPMLALDDVVQRVVHDWCGQNRCLHKTRISLGAPGLQVVFDAEHLRRVLVNLLDNAARYSGERPDAIVVATHARPVETQAGHAVAGDLRVWSDGEPLDPTVHRHLFEPFFSSESRSSGLGLYICRELCERHNAVLGYVREAVRGSARDVEGNCFFVEFNLQQDVARPAERPKVRAPDEVNRT